MEFIFVVMVRSFVNWAVRKQWGSRHSCRVRRSPGRGVVGLEGGGKTMRRDEKRREDGKGEEERWEGRMEWRKE